MSVCLSIFPSVCLRVCVFVAKALVATVSSLPLKFSWRNFHSATIDHNYSHCTIDSSISIFTHWQIHKPYAFESLWFFSVDKTASTHQLVDLFTYFNSLIHAFKFFISSGFGSYCVSRARSHKHTHSNRSAADFGWCYFFIFFIFIVLICMQARFTGDHWPHARYQS